MAEHDSITQSFVESQRAKRIQRETAAAAAREEKTNSEVEKLRKKLEEATKSIKKAASGDRKALEQLARSVTETSRKLSGRKERRKLKMEKFVELGGTKPVEKAPLPQWLRRVDEQRAKEEREYQAAKEAGIADAKSPSRRRKEAKMREKNIRHKLNPFGLRVQSVGYKAKDGSIRIRRKDIEKVERESRTGR